MGLTKANKTSFKKGQVPWNKGKHHSQKTKIKISDAKKLNPIRYWLGKKRPEISERQGGKKHWNWKGGITPERKKLYFTNEYKLWRKSVFERDSFTCQKTGKKGGKLVAHHINNFAEKEELRVAIDNGIALSDEAHREFHKKYGIKNNTLEQLEEFLNKKR